MAGNVKISVRQFTILVVLITIGDALLVLPAIPALEAKQDAWISGIAGMAAGLMIVYLICAVGRLYPHLTLIEYNRAILGKWAGSIVFLVFLTYPFLSAAAHVREIGDFTSTHFMPETPILAIHIIFVAIIVMGVRLGLETIARTGELFFPWFLLFFIFLVVSLSRDVDFNNMQPVLEEGIKPIIRGSFAMMTFPFAELVVFLMIFPYVNRSDKITRGFLWGASFGGLILFIIISMSILVLGPDLTARNMYPSYMLAKTINVGNFLQRLEAVLAFLWIITSYLKITFYFFVFHLGFAQLFKLKDYRVLTLPFSMNLIAFTILVSPNISFFNHVIAVYWPLYDLTYSVMLPLLLLGVHFIRKKEHTQEGIQ